MRARFLSPAESKHGFTVIAIQVENSLLFFAGSEV